MQQAEPSLLEAIDEFLEQVSMSPVTFGRKAMGDPHFVRDLRDGRRVWPETEERARNFIQTFPPEPPTASEREAA